MSPQHWIEAEFVQTYAYKRIQWIVFAVKYTVSSVSPCFPPLLKLFNSLTLCWKMKTSHLERTFLFEWIRWALFISNMTQYTTMQLKQVSTLQKWSRDKNMWASVKEPFNIVCIIPLSNKQLILTNKQTQMVKKLTSMELPWSNKNFKKKTNANKTEFNFFYKQVSVTA